MEFTGERFVPEQTGTIELEHMNRYYFVINQIDLKNKVVLDIASGEGYGTDLLAKHAKHVYGVDISSDAIEHALAKYKRENLNYIEGTAVSIPIDDGIIDVVVSFETIEHHDKHHEMLHEIKRVLKSDGILVISSPDKLYYSDIPKYKNNFHVKELYYEEFKELISSHFNKSIFFSQKVFVGSIIALDEISNEYKKPLVIEQTGNSYEFKPHYNIAIASNNIAFIPDHQLVLYKESDCLFTSVDIELARQSMRMTNTYKLGKLILKPFKWIKALALTR